MRPFPPIARTALIFYLVFAGIVLLLGFYHPAAVTAGKAPGPWEAVAPRGEELDLTGADGFFRSAWLEKLAEEGYSLPQLAPLEASRLEISTESKLRLRWLRNRQELHLPAAFSEENLVRLGLAWKTLATEQGLRVSGSWQLAGRELRLSLVGAAPLAETAELVTVEEIVLIQPLSGSRHSAWNWRGLVPEPEKARIAVRPALKPSPRPSLKPSPKSTPSPRIALTPPPTSTIKRRARVALIIDDVGYDRNLAAQFLQLQTRLTWSVLPFTPHAAELSAAAKEHGFEVLLHLPLEPLDRSINPGPGAIRTDWSETEIIRQLDLDLGEFPGVAGVNNHMGSLGTSDERLMDILLKELKRRGLFFIDSYTSTHSVATRYAVKHEVPHATRQIFIDNSNNLEYKKEQLRELIRLALKNGEAIGIGHVRPGTAQAIREMLPEFARAGVEIVPVSQLVK